VAISCERNDEPSGSGATELVSQSVSQLCYLIENMNFCAPYLFANKARVLTEVHNEDLHDLYFSYIYDEDDVRPLYP
jgi:hypothetical protein